MNLLNIPEILLSQIYRKSNKGTLKSVRWPDPTPIEIYGKIPNELIESWLSPLMNCSRPHNESVTDLGTEPIITIS